MSLQVAAEVLDGTGDGVWLVELAAVADPDAVPSAISRELGITPTAGRGALEALIGALVPQAGSCARKASLAQVRAHLGAAQFDRDYARGMTLTSDEVLDLAAGRGSPLAR